MDPLPTPTPETKSAAELLRRAEITSKARYHAARRMAAHGWFSQWTLAALAVGQIVITLVSALGLHSSFKPQYVNFASAFFGVMVLAYSLLLGMANFAARAAVIHQCGLELGRLARRLLVMRDTGAVSRAEYDECAKQYYDILDKHENHTRTDYLVAHYEYYDSLASKLTTFSKEWWVERTGLLFVRIKLYVLHLVQFSHYIASAVLMYVWIGFMAWR